MLFTSLVAVVLSLLASTSVAGAQSVALKTGSFDERVEKIISELKYVDKYNDELFANQLMLEVYYHPNHFRAEVEDYLLRRVDLDETRARIALAGMQCLNLKDYLSFVDRLSGAGQGKVSEWTIFYSIGPGYEWSTRLDLRYLNAEIRATLRRVERSPNASERVRNKIKHIMDGSSARSKIKEKLAPTLRCREEKP